MLPSTVLAIISASGALGVTWIAPGAVWYDTSGNIIDAHGGGIFKEGDTFYWTGHQAPVPEDPTWQGVTLMMYASKDLVNWDFVGRPAESTSGFWRPKLAKPNSAYWVYGQQDRHVLSLSSSCSVTGPYIEQDKVLLPPNNYSYSDTGLFFDEVSDTYYLLTSADHNTVQVNKIEEDGSVGERASRLNDGDREAPGIFFEGGIYFMILSAKTGYRPNPNKVYWATSLAGPWQGGSDIAPPEVNTYNSQNTFELTIKGTEKTTHIYLGDDWVRGGWADSKYVWLPINVDVEAKTATLEYHDMWKVDVETGIVSFPTTKKRYLSEYNTLSKRSGITEVAFRGIMGTGSLQWIRLSYKTDNPQDAAAYVVVNDKLVANVTDLNSRAGHGSSTPIQLTLKPGNDNTIVLGALGEDAVIEVESLEIFEDDFEL